MRDPILFGDFRMALQEEETRIYEDIQDYEAAKALFQVWTGLTLSMGSRFLGALLGGAQHCMGAQEAELGRIPVPLSQGSERRLASSPVITTSSGAWNDLRSVLNAQTPGLAPLNFLSSSPWRVLGFQCTARFGNHWADSLIFIVVSTHDLSSVISLGSLLADHEPTDPNLNGQHWI